MSKKKINFKRRVMKHLQGMGFNCFITKAFPDIIAWKPFADDSGRCLAVNTQTNLGGDINERVVIPYFVTLIECKENRKLTDKEKLTAKKLLEENRCNSFIIAYSDKKKLEFEELNYKPKKRKEKKELNKVPSYIC